MITYLKHIMKICNTFFINVFYIFIIFMFLLIKKNVKHPMTMIWMDAISEMLLLL